MPSRMIPMLIAVTALAVVAVFAKDVLHSTYQADRLVTLDPVEGHDEQSYATLSARALKDLAIHPEDDKKQSVFHQVSFSIHHNGDPEACGTAPPSVSEMQRAIAELESYNQVLNKYQVESFLTGFFARRLGTGTCGGSWRKTWSSASSLFDFCDMGPDKTVVQLDHEQLVNVPHGDGKYSLPCRFYTREGRQVGSLRLLKELAEQAQAKQEDCPDETCGFVSLDLYAVPAGRMFMFAPRYVGEEFELTHVQDSRGQNLKVKTLSLEPRVFDVFNFFSGEESDELVEKALRETSETHRFHRSTTGTVGKSVFNKRTSENAWDTHGKTAQLIKRRGFKFLGIEDYQESMSDGLQILRYNLTTAYTPHYDYLEDKALREVYNYDTAGKGGNRFATILLYFSDLPEGGGGETVFPKAWPVGLPESERVSTKEAIQQLRASGDADMLEHGSWEEEMVANCRTRLQVQPRRARAVLFYSQHPDGSLDKMSFHGGCPVLKGTKIAANLWTWSGVRPEYKGAPKRRQETPEELEATRQVHATFRNSGKDPRFNENTKVYYDEDGFFGNLGPKDPPVSVNTFKSHRWNIKVNGKTLKTFTITGKNAVEEFIV